MPCFVSYTTTGVYWAGPPPPLEKLVEWREEVGEWEAVAEEEEAEEVMLVLFEKVTPGVVLLDEVTPVVLLLEVEA